MISVSGSLPEEGIGYPLWYYWASLVAQSVKNLSATQETPVGSLGWKDLLEESMATHSDILAWRIPWTEEHGGLQSMGSQRVRHDRETKHTHTHMINLTHLMLFLLELIIHVVFREGSVGDNIAKIFSFCI